jgi:hypothetical protein
VKSDLYKPLKRIARTMLESISAVRPQHWDALRVMRTQAKLPEVTLSADRLRLAIEWLKAAQDASRTGGVAWGYRARRPIRTDLPLGWVPPYPETTGYIIETLLRYASMANDPDCRERALRMAEWELTVQLPDGGIPGGFFGETTAVAGTFVTGQVIFGLLSAFEATRDQKYLEAASHAGDFLLGCLDPTGGHFVRGHSQFCIPGPKAYESRTGWALAWLGQVSGNDRYSDGARRIAGYAVSCQQPNGWFADNDLTDNEIPLTHTIGYVLEGLWETGLILRQDSLLERTLSTLDRIGPLIEKDGFLAGRWNRDWQPAVNWSCLTGSCQIALVFLRANARSPSPSFVASAEKLLRFVTATQMREGANPGLVGGIQGSYPFDGEYGQYSLLNWAAKFYADAMIAWISRQKPAGTGQ